MSIIQERLVNNGHGALNASYFCVHSTANVGATAANHVSLWSRNYEYAVHLVSDWNEAFHTVPYDRLCYQVGNGNRFVEGLEICEATNQEDFEKGIRIAAQVVRERLAAHGWGLDRLITHKQAQETWGGSDHTDPIPYFTRWGYSWDQFKQLVQNGDDDMPTAGELWDYELGSNATPNYNNIPAWVHLSYAHADTAALRAQLLRTDDGGTKDGSSGDLYTRVCYMDMRIREMSATMTAQAEALKTLASSMGADPTTIADTVAKAVKEKLDNTTIKMVTTDDKEGK